MKNLFQMFALACVVALLVGCNQIKPRLDVDLLSTTDAAAASLLRNSQGVSPDATLLVASFVSVDNLMRSSTFGRVSAELFSSALSRRGYSLVEVKLRDELFIQQRGGEFMLSRNLQNISETHQVQSVVLGTYAVGIDYVYVTVKMVNAQNSNVQGAWQYRIPRTDEMRSLLPAREPR